MHHLITTNISLIQIYHYDYDGDLKTLEVMTSV
jgi:hypothetical protein